MKIQITEIPQEGLEIEGEETLEAETVGVWGPVRVKLRAEKIGPDVVVKGDIRAEVELICSRCLVDFRHELVIPIEVEYRPLDELKGDEKAELDTGELETGFYRNDELDIGELAKEQVLLNIPMKPLCRDSCKGICPRCGRDLSRGACGCINVGMESRLESLKKLLP